MSELLKNIASKISSYNIFNNLYPGIIFCYLLKLIIKTSILTDNWVENIVVFYFVGMIMSRVGSVIIEPLFKRIKLLQYASYRDYERASKVDELITTLSEVNNTYRTLIACFVCLILSKFGCLINHKLVAINCSFFQDNGDWMLLILLFGLFSFSYIKQTNYIRKRVESLIERIGPRS